MRTHTVRRGIERGQISRDGNGDDGGNGNEDKNRGDNGIHEHMQGGENTGD